MRDVGGQSSPGNMMMLQRIAQANYTEDWLDPGSPPEPDSWAYRVTLADGRTIASAHAGASWWGDGGRSLAPIAWRPIRERAISA